MFQLTSEEVPFSLKSQFATLNIEGNKRGMHIKKLPFAFTEEGIYMLSTVLKGELAVSQSIMIMRTFKEMRHYIAENNSLVSQREFQRFSIQMESKTNQLQSNIEKIMDNFIEDVPTKEIVILNNHKFDATEAYQKIITDAKKSIIIIDDYMNIDTLRYFKSKKPNVELILFTDNKGHGKNKLTKKEIDDFNSQLGKIIIKENGISHDRFIITDYNTVNTKVYLSGTSLKDAGNKLCTIILMNDSHMISEIIEKLLCGNDLILK